MTNKLLPGTRDDLKRVFLHIHASAIVDTIPDVAADLKIKRQYAGELIGILERVEDKDGNPLVHVNSQPGESGNDSPHVYYSTFYTVDDRSQEEMDALFDEAVPVSPVPQQETPAPADATKKTAKRDPNPANLPQCLCGCGAPVNSRNRNYKPGHDARHAGAIGKAVGLMDPEETANENRQAMLEFLPTDALRQKADAMGRRIWAKGQAKAAAKHEKAAGSKPKDEVPPVEFVSGEVKLGRWKYPAEKNMTSGAVTFTRKGKTEVADDNQAATFNPTHVQVEGTTV